MTRDKHLQWCKDRALEYARTGDSSSAIASMLSDLGKHPETASSAKALSTLSMMMLIGGHLEGRQAIEKFINGFN